jgi:hypothetical protein
MPLTRISLPRVLFLEGRQDVGALAAMGEANGIHDVFAHQYGGVDNLREELKALRVATGFSQVVGLGVIRDADGDPVAAFQSVSASLQQEGFAVPPSVGSTAQGNPRVTAFLMPGGGNPGCLEDLLLAAWPEPQELRCVDDYLDCLSEINGVDGTMSKARIQALLASRRPPRGITEGARKGVWDFQSGVFNEVVDFFRSF